jgi:ATP-dependent Clp protease ATP-binding subunit ClpA
MVDLGSYKDKFADSGQRILEHALNESRKRDQNFVSVEHILQALTVEEPDMFNSAMRDLSLDPVVVKMAIEKRLTTSRQQHVGKGFRIGSDTTDLFKRAMERARNQGRKTIEATDIFEALSNEDRGSETRTRGRTQPQKVRTASLPQTFWCFTKSSRSSRQDSTHNRSRKRDPTDHRDPVSSRTGQLTDVGW